MRATGLKIESLTRSYDWSKPVIDSLNLELAPGRFHVLLGKNGAGKSTLMRVLSGQDPFDSGSVTWMGQPFGSWGIGPRAEVAHIAEGLPLSSVLTLADFARINQEICGDLGTDDWAAKVEKEVGFPLDRKYSSYSRGQVVRVLFEVALLRRPTLILMDEVTSVLDANVRRIVFGKLEKFKAEGGTIVLATNIISEVHQLADEYHMLENGKITLQGSLELLQKKFRKFRAKKGAVAPAAAGRAIEVDIAANGEIGYVISAHELKEISSDYSEETPSLSDVFIYLTNLRSEK